MRRFLIVGVAAAVVTLIPLSALAKGEGDQVSGSAVISGPGAAKPLVLSHAPGDETTWEFASLLQGSGLESGSEDGWYELAPNPATLGAGYAIDWVVRGDGRAWTMHQVLYPFATGRPWFYTPPGQLFMNRKIAAWWSGSPSVLNMLHGIGFPRTSAAAAAQPPPLPASQAIPGVGDARPWVWGATFGSFLLLMALGAIAARRDRAEVHEA